MVVDMSDKVYNLGAVGLGHWFDRLHAGMKKANRIMITKAVGTSPIESKLTLLARFGIPTANYYQADKYGHIPEQFYNGIDIVHISDPNQFHAMQSIDALERQKYVVVEKTIATNENDFNSTIKYLIDNKQENNLYLHLHYLHKLLTMELNHLLEKLSQHNGKINKIESVFFEEENDEDFRRSKWLFAPESGGLFMDWIHPFEVILNGARADSVKLDNIKQYVINESYTTIYPTGIESKIIVNGRHFIKDTKWTSKIGKGVKDGQQKKTVHLYFESGNILELNYKNSEKEFSSTERGTWNLYDKNNNIIAKGSPSGMTASELLVSDILELCNGKGPMLKINEIKKLFQPQWDYQKMSINSALIKNKKEINAFISNTI